MSARFIFIIALVFFGLVPTYSWGASPELKISANQFYPIEKLKYGDVLIAKTRIDNDEMYSFPIEIMSINKNNLVNYNSIIATSKDPYINEVGLAEGMSGSPVYYEGKLVGAIAFGYTFVRKPIIGITPIQEMLGIITNQNKEPNDDYYDNFLNQGKTAFSALPAYRSYPHPDHTTQNAIDIANGWGGVNWWKQNLHELLYKHAILAPAWNNFLELTKNTITDPKALFTLKKLIAIQNSPTTLVASTTTLPNYKPAISPDLSINQIKLPLPLLINNANQIPIVEVNIRNSTEPNSLPNLLSKQFPGFSLHNYPSILPKKNLQSVNISKSTAPAISSSPLQAGDYIGVNLVRGDLEISAFGTVTYIQDDFLLAFGHGMNGLGSVKLPLYRARTEMIVPRQDISFKVGTLLEEIGSVVQDRNTGIMGKIGESANYLPITAKVKSPVQERTFHFEVVNNKLYGPWLATFILDRMFFLYEGRGQPATIDYTITVDYEKSNTVSSPSTSASVVLSNRFSADDNNFNVFLVKNDMNLLYKIIQQHERDLGIITNIRIAINTLPNFKVMHIASITSEKTVYRPGEMIRLKIGFDRYQSTRVYQDFTYRIPVSTKAGQYQLGIGSSVIRWLSEAFIGKYDYALNSIDGLIKILATRPMENELSLWQMTTKPSIQIKNQLYGQLPANQQKLLLSSLHNEKENSTIDINYSSYRIADKITGFSYFGFTVKE